MVLEFCISFIYVIEQPSFLIN